TFVAAGTAGSGFALARYWGDDSPPSYALGSTDAIFVDQVYLDLLVRPVDPTGVNAWTSRMTQGATRAQVVLAIEQSTEYRTRLVENLYATYLGRQADAAGLNAFVAALSSGATIEQVKAIFLGSPEFYQKTGGSNAVFVQA